MTRNFQQIFSFRDGDEEPGEPVEEPATPPWFGPPEGELGQTVPAALVVGRSDLAVVAVRHVTAYSTGLALDVFAAARGLGELETQRLLHAQHIFSPEEEASDTFLRLGVEFSDGARASNLARVRPAWSAETEPSGPVFSHQGGGGGGAGGGRLSLDQSYWLWPLPPPGPLRLYVEWPAVGIGLASVELDTAPLLSAARRSEQLWPE